MSARQDSGALSAVLQQLQDVRMERDAAEARVEELTRVLEGRGGAGTLAEIEDIQREYETALSTLRQQVTSLTALNSTRQQEIDSLTHLLRKNEAEQNSSDGHRQAELAGRTEALQDQNNELRQEVLSLTTIVRRLRDDRQPSTSGRSIRTPQEAPAPDTLQILRDQISDQKQTISEQKKKIAQLERDAESEQQRNDLLEHENAQRKKGLADAQQQRDENATLRSKVHSVEGLNKDLKGEVDAMHAKTTRLTEELRRAEEGTDAAAKLTRRVHMLEDEEERLQKKVRYLSDLHEEDERQLTALQAANKEKEHIITELKGMKRHEILTEKKVVDDALLKKDEEMSRLQYKLKVLKGDAEESESELAALRGRLRAKLAEVETIDEGRKRALEDQQKAYATLSEQSAKMQDQQLTHQRELAEVNANHSEARRLLQEEQRLRKTAEQKLADVPPPAPPQRRSPTPPTSPSQQDALRNALLEVETLRAANMALQMEGDRAHSLHGDVRSKERTIRLLEEEVGELRMRYDSVTGEMKHLQAELLAVSTALEDATIVAEKAETRAVDSHTTAASMQVEVSEVREELSRAYMELQKFKQEAREMQGLAEGLEGELIKEKDKRKDADQRDRDDRLEELEDEIRRWKRSKKSRRVREREREREQYELDDDYESPRRTEYDDLSREKEALLSQLVVARNQQLPFHRKFRTGSDGTPVRTPVRAAAAVEVPIVAGAHFRTDKAGRNKGGWNTHFLTVATASVASDSVNFMQLLNTTFSFSDIERLVASKRLTFLGTLAPREMEYWMANWPTEEKIAMQQCAQEGVGGAIGNKAITPTRPTAYSHDWLG